MKTPDKLNRINSIIPARIREARIARGYTIEELARNIGVTKQAVSQFELGRNEPSPEVFKFIMDELNFPLIFFTNKRYTLENTSKSLISFRAQLTSQKRAQESLKVRTEWIIDIYNYLSEFIDFPNINIPVDLVETKFEEEYSQDEIEMTTSKLREYWELGNSPIENMVSLLHLHGVPISKFSFANNKIEGFSQWINSVPVIILGDDNQTSVRNRFSLAHELGHLILHPFSIDTKISKEKHKRMENEANYFASAFLMPEKSFSGDIFNISLDAFIMIKDKWKVSLAAMIKRCYSLNIINENQRSYLYRVLNKKGWRKCEPLDDEIEIENPYMLKQAVMLLLDNKIITTDDIQQNIPFYENEIEQLCLLPKDTLVSNKQINIKNMITIKKK